MSDPIIGCGLCHWAAGQTADDGDEVDVPVLECHRRSPAVIVIQDEVCVMWPQVAGDDWCGEFSP